VDNREFGVFHVLHEPLIDILIVHDIVGGIYNGERGRLDAPCDGCGGKACQEAYDTEKYSYKQIYRVIHAACQKAMDRSKKLCIADKADKLESSRLWREAAEDVLAGFPLIVTEYLYIEEAVRQLVVSPGQFDVIVTSNLFGDILFGAARALTGQNQ